MEIAGSDEEAEQAAPPLVELDQAAAADSNGDVGPAMVAGAGDVGLVSTMPMVEVEVLEEECKDLGRCGGLKRRAGRVGGWRFRSLVTSARSSDQLRRGWNSMMCPSRWSSHMFCSAAITATCGCTRIKNSRRSRTGFRPSYCILTSTILARAPGPRRARTLKIQERQDHGQVDGGSGTKSQDYRDGTKFVNGAQKLQEPKGL